MIIYLHDAVREAKFLGFKYVAIDNSGGIYAYKEKPILNKLSLEIWDFPLHSKLRYLGEYEYPVSNFEKMVVKVSDIL